MMLLGPASLGAQSCHGVAPAKPETLAKPGDFWSCSRLYAPRSMLLWLTSDLPVLRSPELRRMGVGACSMLLILSSDSCILCSPLFRHSGIG